MNTPPVGRPLSLGEDVDSSDAEALLAILRIASKTRARRGAGSMHTAREALWSLWERPRLPAPLIGGKYPSGYPWSPGARATYAASGKRPTGGWGLILEHLTPRNLLLEALFISADEMTTDELIALLADKLIATVMTKVEDQQLNAAKVGRARPQDGDPQDLWARYRAAGLEPMSFGPLA